MIDWREVKAATKKEQAAALCCRISSLREFQVLLISSLETNRWILPKGNIEFKEKAYRCAQREAFEEAGVEGKIKKRPLGCYRYLKDGGIDTEVSVHLLRLILEQDIYPETGLRQKLWTSPAKAADLVLEPDLAEIIATFTDLTKLVSQDRNILRKSALKKMFKVLDRPRITPPSQFSG
ncbi:NUDIX domain-containing protein [Aliirhizobium cellulosilyticum]|uniref:8-oxo-dGTP pyrophosphatase MutT (NUDIX family) n=1 Tax=Aliirhizobium cellulosilyticum TaxID=393664 RepID=A0A7W6TF50_9HYPH|nr:8-oxo-dGTP pyrophosphatase MutT (NUDIX family) [Rhizobium cellulosilyticum]MBB4412353.1 8-oxo-dGTP pyrophosphatase MutT (NUDIX family) [Rhizobium cellulosilyticum]MBB4446984.1 8-oxo-dGTP pyrophosphatase MutT (NUDIX family) [Rhizobium cellulosilyticum]